MDGKRRNNVIGQYVAVLSDVDACNVASFVIKKTSQFLPKYNGFHKTLVTLRTL